MATERAMKATTMARIVLMAGFEDYPPVSRRSSDVIVSPLIKLKIE
jgi:hypothetical protein